RLSLGRTVYTGIGPRPIGLLAGREAARSASHAAVRVGEARVALGTRRRGRSIRGDEGVFVIHGRLAHESGHPWVQQVGVDLSLGAGGVAESIHTVRRFFRGAALRRSWNSRRNSSPCNGSTGTSAST